MRRHVPLGAVICLMLTSCALISPDKSGRPKTCQERVARDLAVNYPDPTLLGKAVEIACSGVAIP